MTTFHPPGGKPESVPTDIGSLDMTKRNRDLEQRDSPPLPNKSSKKVFPPADAVRVDMLQHAHAVAQASRDLAGCSSGVQPQQQGGVPQVVMCSSQP